MPPSYSYNIRSSARSRTASEPAIFLSCRTNEEKRMDIGEFIAGKQQPVQILKLESPRARCPTSARFSQMWVFLLESRSDGISIARHVSAGSVACIQRVAKRRHR